MAANCAQLRQSLAHLQSQLNTLTNKQKEESSAPEKPEKTDKKKSKSKKNKAEKAKAEAEKAATATVESDDAKDVAEEILPTTSEDTAQNETEKVDEKTLENLIQAINNANINLCDLEVVNDEINEIKTEEVKQSTVNVNLSASPAEETLTKDTEVTNQVDDIIETNINDVNEVISKFLNEVKDVTNVNGCDESNVSVVELTNDEVSHLNEVKPIVSDA